MTSTASRAACVVHGRHAWCTCEGPMVADEKLTRTGAGTYRTPDGRFRVASSDGLWYLTDTARVDELGQPRLCGPYRTLGEARRAAASARSGLGGDGRGEDGRGGAQR